MSGQMMYADLESPPVSTEEDHRTLQIALELSNLGLLGAGDDDSSTSSYDDVTKGKKSQNMTECVPVPSSEHVAEIVGRQGCKIKALRSKTSTYIKTPVRGEEPVFVVTGRKEDVAMARREIQSAAEHFTQIRATRNKPGIHTNVPPLPGLATYNTMAMPSGNTSPDLTSPGSITLQVRVPYRVVGLVVGPKGATIKRIQLQTHTYIVTPSRDKEPVFEVSGLPENVEKAKEEIEAHIAARTGSQSRDIDDDFASNGTVVGSPASFNRSQSAFTPYRSTIPNTKPDFFPMPQLNSQLLSHINGYSKYTTNSQTSLLDMTSNSGLGVFSQHNRPSIEHYEMNSDHPLTSPTLAYDPASSAASWSTRDFQEVQPFLFGGTNETMSPLGPIRLSPTLSDDFLMQPAMSVQSPLTQPPARVASESIDSTGNCQDLEQPARKQSSGISIESGYSSGSTSSDSQTSGSPVENICFRSTSPPPLRVCLICKETEIMAALVPCGHRPFCLNCARKVVDVSALCPRCSHLPTFAMLIHD